MRDGRRLGRGTDDGFRGFIGEGFDVLENGLLFAPDVGEDRIAAWHALRAMKELALESAGVEQPHSV